MKLKTLLFVGVVSLGAISAVNVSAQPNAPITVSSGQSVTNFDIPRGTQEYEQVRLWLADAVTRTGNRVGSPSNLDQANLGDALHVQVVHQSIAGRGVTTMVAPNIPPPPWTPGTNGYQVGDTATVGVTNDGWTQTWTLTLMNTNIGFQWVATDYHATYDTKHRPVPN